MKIKYKKKDLFEWHEKFAWLPTSVDDEEDQKTIVWFEKIMQRSERFIAANKKHSWIRYSKKAYFKKKLNGEFDKSPGRGVSEEAQSGSSPVGGSAGVGLNKPTNTVLKHIHQQTDPRHNQ